MASSPNMGASVAQLNDQANQLLPSFKSKIKTKVLRKEVQHWAMTVIQVCERSTYAWCGISELHANKIILWTNVQYLAEQARDFKGDVANDYNCEDERIWIEAFAWIKACMWRENFRHEVKAANCEHAGNTINFSKHHAHVPFCENRWNQLLWLQYTMRIAPVCSRADA